MDYPSQPLDAIWQQFGVIRSLVAWVTRMYQQCPLIGYLDGSFPTCDHFMEEVRRALDSAGVDPALFVTCAAETGL